MVDRNTKTIWGWGQYPRVECDVQRPERLRSVSTSIDPSGTIARGLGRSYGDSAINAEGVVVDLTRLDRFLEFDAAEGLLRCEAGASLADILEHFAPRGFLPMITPGTKHVTVGGCIANDIHGKAHHVDGTFANCVESMEVMLASGDVVTASRQENSDLFWASFGGMGLLGIILSATIRLRPVETTYFRQEAIRVENLDEMLDALKRYDATHPYSVAWIDPLATGDRLGRGVLTVGDHAALDELPASLRREPLAVTSGVQLEVPFNMPSWSLNPATIRVLNRIIEAMQGGASPISHYEKFFYPLDFVHEWNRGYGKRGFTQYQFVIPFDDGRARLRAIMERIATSGFLPFLNVLKRFGDQGEGHLSFPFPGYTLAIDFPIRDGLGEFLRSLDEMVLDAGGRVYLAKDAFLDAETFAAMYPRLDEWRAIKQKWDPDGTFTSNQARRVGLV
jgi:FAD/FMN-containing dehydrogenase